MSKSVASQGRVRSSLPPFEARWKNSRCFLSQCRDNQGLSQKWRRECARMTARILLSLRLNDLSSLSSSARDLLGRDASTKSFPREGLICHRTSPSKCSCGHIIGWPRFGKSLQRLLTRTSDGAGGLGGCTGLEGGEELMGFKVGDSTKVSPVRDLDSWSGLLGGVGSGVGLAEAGWVNTNCTLGLVLGESLHILDLANALTLFSGRHVVPLQRYTYLTFKPTTVLRTCIFLDGHEHVVVHLARGRVRSC
jgi:hypothetical protein